MLAHQKKTDLHNIGCQQGSDCLEVTLNGRANQFAGAPAVAVLLAGEGLRARAATAPRSGDPAGGGAQRPGAATQRFAARAA